jgi:hypothetical protein
MKQISFKLGGKLVALALTAKKAVSVGCLVEPTESELTKQY